MSRIDELVQKFRDHVPEEKTDEEIRDLIDKCDADEEEVQKRIAEWWEAAGGEENDEEEEEETPAEAPGAAEEENGTPSPQQEEEGEAEGGDAGGGDAEGEENNDAPPAEDPPKETSEPEAPQKETPPSPSASNDGATPKSSKRSGSSKSRRSGSQDKEMMDFRHLMVKGLELKRYKSGSSEKCVIYMDVTCRTFFCAKQKNAANAKAYRVEDITEASASGTNEKIISIVHKEGQLDLEVSSPKVRDYLVRMLNKLFALEKTRNAEDQSSSSGGGSSKRKEGSSRRGKSSSGRSSSRRDRDRDEDDVPRSRGRHQVSQVRLLAEHCYSMGDEKIEELVTAKIPTHSRWESYQEFKDKINRRDELIRSLQDGLGTINSERVRFQRACEDIELHHQDELQELKQHLAMALQSFQELQRASEHRESEMREALKGAMERSQKFEQEKSTLMDSMNDQRMNAAASEKEVEMLREAIKKQTQELEKKGAECEDTRKRFAQVKEALTVERNLRARAEIKEEQMRQETIAMTGQMHAQRDKFQTEIHDNSKEVEDRTAELEEKIQVLEEEKAKLQEDIESKEQEIKVVTGEVEGLKAALDETENKAESLAVLAEKAGLVEGLQHQIDSLQAEKAKMIESHAAAVEELKKTIADQEDKLTKADETRRKMHNIIQELRGNIRVYIRVRPFLPGDGVDLEGKLRPSTVTKNDGCTAEISRYEGADVAETHKWSFDKAFDMATTQDDIFKEVSEFVQSALDGFNVCLFSYGQTGSGKTHTMQGYGRGEMSGIIPRAIGQIGNYRDTMAKKGWEYTMQVTFIEIYNEVVYDLLRSEGEEKESLDIKQDNRGRTYVAGANKLDIDPVDTKAIDDLMDTAALHRQTATTNMNAQSSRSHSIFTLYLEGINQELGARVRGTLHLCDLAGSERISRSGAEGDRLKEAVNINKSLSCLTDVFNALGNKQAFIPFRNSKLTYFLQPALSGDGKTMMFVNLSPTEESYFESLCSLRFASNVSKVELGKAQRNVSELPSGNDKGASGGDRSGSSPPKKQSAARLTGGGTRGSSPSSRGTSPGPRRGGASRKK